LIEESGSMTERRLVPSMLIVVVMLGSCTATGAGDPSPSIEATASRRAPASCRKTPTSEIPVIAYATYFGGSGAEGGVVAVDGSGTTYLAGTTTSTDLPAPASGFRFGPRGQDDVFVTELDPCGAPVWMMYLGGSGNDELFDVTVDASGVYLNGQTESADLPTSAGAFDQTYNGGTDAFLVKLATDGSRIAYSTYLGGTGFDGSERGVAIAPSGAVVLAGVTGSRDFPTTVGAFQTRFAGGDDRLEPIGVRQDAFLAELDPSGSMLVFSTLVGGRGDDAGGGPKLDTQGNVVLAGATTSTNFPITPGAFQTRHADGPRSLPSDGYVMAFDPSGSRLLWSTFLGGPTFDTLHGLALGPDDAPYVTGETCGGFPVTSGVFQMTYGGECDHVVARLTPNGVDLAYASYLGGSGGDLEAEGIAVGPSGRAFLIGETASTDFPVTKNAFQDSLAGDVDGYVSVVSADGATLEFSTYFGGSAADSSAGSGPGLDAQGTLSFAGFTESEDLPTTANAFQPSFDALDDVFLLTIAFGSG
jgi:hypothetical protein